MLSVRSLSRTVFQKGGYQKNWITIGIMREEKNRWETRCPISPSDVKALLKLPDVNFVVQPCTKRIFTDKEFSQVTQIIISLQFDSARWAQLLMRTWQSVT